MSTSSSPLLMNNENPIDNNNEEVEKIPNTRDDNDSTKSAPKPYQSFIAIFIILGLCALLSWATETWIEYAIAFGIQYLVFTIHSWPFHSEKFYDFTGMLTYITLCIASFFYHETSTSNRFENIRNVVITCLIIIWTLRLGFFQLQRLSKGHDPRFANKIYNFSFFLLTWTLQGQWCYFVAGILVGVINQNNDLWSRTPLNALDYAGWVIWLFGFSYEAIADHQKSVFKKNPNNRNKFCNVGLWKYSRRPSYFGEITLWIGIAMSSCNVAKDAGFILLISPLWTMFLLIFVSGIPIAEANAEKRYGKLPEYKEYKESTPVLIPFCFCWK